MIASPSKVQRTEDMEAKTAQEHKLIAEIVPMIDNLDAQGLREIYAYLEAKINKEKSTTVVIRGTPLKVASAKP